MSHKENGEASALSSGCPKHPAISAQGETSNDHWPAGRPLQTPLLQVIVRKTVEGPGACRKGQPAKPRHLDGPSLPHAVPSSTGHMELLNVWSLLWLCMGLPGCFASRENTVRVVWEAIEHIPCRNLAWKLQHHDFSLCSTSQKRHRRSSQHIIS